MTCSEERGEEQLTQLYFWGGHGGVGGGDSRQLDSSDTTLRFCVEEIQRRGIGLALNMELIPEYGDIETETDEIKSSAIMGFVEKITGKFVRPIESVDHVHHTAVKRFQRVTSWRPAALEGLSSDLLSVQVD